MPQSEPPLPNRAHQGADARPQELHQGRPDRGVGRAIGRGVVLHGPVRAGQGIEHLAQAPEARALPAAHRVVVLDDLEPRSQGPELRHHQVVDARVGDDDDLVALEPANPGEALGEVAGGALDERVAGVDLASRLGFFDHPQGDAVLHAAGQAQLELGPELGTAGQRPAARHADDLEVTDRVEE